MLSESQIIEIMNQSTSDPGVKMGLGDDAFVLEVEPGRKLVAATDAMVEGVHFSQDHLSPMDLAHKLVAVNVSDMAAMGADPAWAMLTLSLPRNLDNEWVVGFQKGLAEALKTYHIQLIGGDTTASVQSIFTSLVLLGWAKPDEIKTRKSIQTGDVLVVVGHLGQALVGLQICQMHRHLARQSVYRAALEAFRRPKPLLREAQFLRQSKFVHAMMDVSDGLLNDANKLARSGSKGLHIEIEKVLLPKVVCEFSEELEQDPVELVLAGGEDYALLLAVDPAGLNQLLSEFRQRGEVPIYKIGEFVDPEIGHLKLTRFDEPYSSEIQGFEHF